MESSSAAAMMPGARAEAAAADGSEDDTGVGGGVNCSTDGRPPAIPFFSDFGADDAEEEGTGGSGGGGEADAPVREFGDDFLSVEDAATESDNLVP